MENVMLSKDPNLSQLHRARRYSLSLRDGNDSVLTQNDDELLAILDDLERDDSVIPDILGQKSILKSPAPSSLTAVLYAFFERDFDL